MSQLRLFRPERIDAPHCDSDDAFEPYVIPFAPRSQRIARNRINDTVTRARILSANCRCPACRHPVTEPIELADGMYTRNNLPIPGTATLVGFRCTRCHVEWPA